MDCFRVDHLDIERLLPNWRWLVCGHKRLVARSAFGDLFLEDDAGKILRLDVSIGKLETIAESDTGFRELTGNPATRDKWFAEADECGFAAKGLAPNEVQCIGFDIPLVFKEGVRKPYLIDIYEHVSFLGDLNQQIANVPDGGKVKLIVGSRPQITDELH